jgi:hypothetical protein
LLLLLGSGAGGDPPLPPPHSTYPPHADAPILLCSPGRLLLSSRSHHATGPHGHPQPACQQSPRRTRRPSAVVYPSRLWLLPSRRPSISRGQQPDSAVSFTLTVNSFGLVQHHNDSRIQKKRNHVPFLTINIQSPLCVLVLNTSRSNYNGKI